MANITPNIDEAWLMETTHELRSLLHNLKGPLALAKSELIFSPEDVREGALGMHLDSANEACDALTTSVLAHLDYLSGQTSTQRSRLNERP